ncbi:uncharacterized protein LOC129973094 [Argiope bruennichi]|uniref:uncharacterized protein LOC129973094 n=1 Tax=Argiope bruennichi TaxID=94029 RepID=UPI0024956C8F|nr:uncharacterized protein LOC129973094 [Argiope bruennichi]
MPPIGLSLFVVLLVVAGVHCGEKCGFLQRECWENQYCKKVGDGLGICFFYIGKGGLCNGDSLRCRPDLECTERNSLIKMKTCQERSSDHLSSTTPSPYSSDRSWWQSTPRPYSSDRPWWQSTPRPYSSDRPWWQSTPRPYSSDRPWWQSTYRPYSSDRPWWQSTYRPYSSDRPWWQSSPNPYSSDRPWWYSTTRPWWQ